MDAPAIPDTLIEPRVQAIGAELFDRIESISPGPSPAQRVMKFTLGDEAVKAQLFRFVDCLPTLVHADDIVRHLREYLAPVTPNLSRFFAADGALSSALAAVVGWSARKMARTFIAATDLAEAAIAIARLRRERLAFTLDLLGESVVSEREADAYQAKYLALVSDLPGRLANLPTDELLDSDAAGPIPRANISLKLSSLHSQFDPIDPSGTTEAVLRRLIPILRLARQRGAFINLDMEQHAWKNLTIHIFTTALMTDEFRDWRDVGIAIQAYLKSTAEDLRGLADWSRRRGTPVWVRLVKGAYWDMECVIAAQNGWSVPVFTEKSESDASFESATRFLIENRKNLRPAIATHNVRGIAAALAMAEHAGLAPAEMEFQMLYGMAAPVKAALVQMGRRVRVYTPFGKLLPGMAYLVRRLLENTSNESFLRAGFLDHVPREQLLMNPKNRTHHPVVPIPIRPFENHPPADFSLEVVRRNMADAIAEYEPRDYPLVIDGEEIKSEGWIESINPSHKIQIVGRAGRATVADAHRAVAAAKTVFAKWRDTPAEDRAGLLDRVAENFSDRRFELAAIEVHECGKPWREADSDIAEAIDFCRYYAWQMRVLAGGGGADFPGEENRWTYEPRGVAVVIAPWNFPLAILCGMTAAAVVTGNPVVMKPAEQSPIIAAHLARAFSDCGAPAGVVNYLPGIGEEIGPALVADPDVAIIAFTGSRSVGLGINQEAAETLAEQDHVKRVIVEMGGKNAIIVGEDADLDEAVSGIIASAFGYSGQKCSACSRVVALAGVHDALLARLVESAASLKIAPAEDPGCRIGPVIDAEAAVRIHEAIERGKTQATLAWAGNPGALSEEGFYIAPHIFSQVDPASSLASEEIFGPVLAVMRAKNLDDALAIANSSRYALTGGIYSRSPANIEKARREFRVGNLYINRRITGALVGRQPFGGFKLSGGGTQAGGPDYLRHFLLPRCITENTMRHGFIPQADNRPTA